MSNTRWCSTKRLADPLAALSFLAEAGAADVEPHSFGPRGERWAPSMKRVYMCEHAWGKNSVPPLERKKLPSSPPLQHADVSNLANRALQLPLNISLCAGKDRRSSEGCYYLAKTSPPFSITMNEAIKKGQALPGHAAGARRLPPFLPTDEVGTCYAN